MDEVCDDGIFYIPIHLLSSCSLAGPQGDPHAVQGQCVSSALIPTFSTAFST